MPFVPSSDAPYLPFVSFSSLRRIRHHVLPSLLLGFAPALFGLALSIHKTADEQSSGSENSLQRREFSRRNCPPLFLLKMI